MLRKQRIIEIYCRSLISNTNKMIHVPLLLYSTAISTTDTTKDFHLNTGDTKFRRDIPDDNPPDFAKIVNKYWKGVMGGLALSMLAALLMVYLMRWLAAPILWSYIVTIHVICLIGKDSKKDNALPLSMAGQIIIIEKSVFFLISIFPIQHRFPASPNTLKEIIRRKNNKVVSAPASFLL